MTHSLLLKQQKMQMMNPSKHNNRQGHQGIERGVSPRSICTMNNEEKPMKITNHEKGNMREGWMKGTWSRIFGDRGTQ